MIVLWMLAGASMGFAVHQWWNRHHLMVIRFITFALIMGGVSIEAAKNRQAAEAEGAPGHAGELLR